MRKAGIWVCILYTFGQILAPMAYSEEYRTKAGFVLNFVDSDHKARADVSILHNGKWLPEAEASAAIKGEIADQHDKEVIEDPIAYRSPSGGVAHFGDGHGNRISKEEYIRLAELQMEQSLADTDKAEAHIRATTTPEIYAINQPAFEEGRQLARQFFKDTIKSLEGIERPGITTQGLETMAHDSHNNHLPNMVLTSIVPMKVLQVDELVSATAHKVDEQGVVPNDPVAQETFAAVAAIHPDPIPIKAESPKCLVSYEVGFKGSSAG